MSEPHILILGGTGEARRLAQALAPICRVTLSLAGRTRDPLLPDVATRIGGFGGTDGLADYLRENGITRLVDATHPFAARITDNARDASRAAGVALLRLERPAWMLAAGDRWRIAETMEDAAELIGPAPRRVFLAVGRQELEPFAAHPQHRYLIRSVEAPDLPSGLRDARLILARGPFHETSERALLESERIEVLVAKNSGGAATYGKIAAARALGLPVVMVRRPRPPVPGAVHSVAEALSRLRHEAAPQERGE